MYAPGNVSVTVRVVREVFASVEIVLTECVGVDADELGHGGLTVGDALEGVVDDLFHFWA